MNKVSKKSYLFGCAAVVVLAIIIIFGVKSCGVSHSSPESVVKSLIKSYAKGKEKNVLECYGIKDIISDELEQQIDATIKYYKAHNPEKVKIKYCDVLSENLNYSYVYIVYEFVMENKQAYPCISTYMVKEDDGKYYIASSAEITSGMNDQAAQDYKKFMTTDIYEEYVTAYETFTKKHPGYEKKIAGKVS